MILPEFGPGAQAALRDAHAMVVGLGALGCPAADLLARAGVGLLTLVDRDLVEATNLQRQTLFDETDASSRTPKAVAAAHRLRRVNSAIRIEAMVEDLGGPDVERMLTPHPRPGVLLDCTDNFQTRYLLNDLAVKLNIPLCYGGAVGTTGLAMTILPGRTPCLRCVFPEAPDPAHTPTCDTAGIFAPVSAIVAANQAADAIKVLIGRHDRLAGSLLRFDLWQNQRQRIDLRSARREDCPCCGLRRFEHLERARTPGAAVLCGRNSVQLTPDGAEPPDLPALADRLRAHAEVRLLPTMLHARLREAQTDASVVEFSVFSDGRAIVTGTTEPAIARSLHARFIGR
jgi:adenylyltransferase/sulfurtransferase